MKLSELITELQKIADQGEEWKNAEVERIPVFVIRSLILTIASLRARSKPEAARRGRSTGRCLSYRCDRRGRLLPAACLQVSYKNVRMVFGKSFP